MQTIAFTQNTRVIPFTRTKPAVYFGVTEDGKYLIQDGSTIFNGCTGIKTLSNVQFKTLSLPDNLFSGSQSLTNIEIANFNVGKNVFANCPNLKKVNFYGTEYRCGTDIFIWSEEEQAVIDNPNKAKVTSKTDGLFYGSTIENVSFAKMAIKVFEGPLFSGSTIKETFSLGATANINFHGKAFEDCNAKTVYFDISGFRHLFDIDENRAEFNAYLTAKGYSEEEIAELLLESKKHLAGLTCETLTISDTTYFLTDYLFADVKADKLVLGTSLYGINV